MNSEQPERTAPVTTSLTEEVGSMLASGALSGTAAHFSRPRGANLIARTMPLEQWHETREAHGVWPYSRSLDSPPFPIATIHDESGHFARGINFASQDYLSLASNSSITEAATKALRDFGPHSAGSAILLGNTKLSLLLESSVGALVNMEHVALFPTGWGAAFGVITALVQPADHIIIDQLAHASLRQGAAAATANIYNNRHLDVEDTRQILKSIREKDASNAILVVTEGLFSMDSDSPDLAALQSVCHEYEGTLLVDVAHDLGAMGPGGSGIIGAQDMLGKIDLVMGAFSKTFASNGGFVATGTRSVKRHLQLFAGPHMFSNAMSPVQASVVLECLRIIRSEDGNALRASLLRNVETLRGILQSRNLVCLGEASPIVPILIGSEKVSRLTGRFLFEESVFVNQVEFPGVPIGASRLRLQLMANHNAQQLNRAAQVISEAVLLAQSAVSDGVLRIDLSGDPAVACAV